MFWNFLGELLKFCVQSEIPSNKIQTAFRFLDVFFGWFGICLYNVPGYVH